MRYGAARVDPAAGSPPSEPVMSDRTILPLASHGRVNSSSVPTSTLPARTPSARTALPVGRPALCMNMTGCAVPATPPPATRIGSNGVARRRRFEVRVAVAPARGVAADPAAAADPRDPARVLVHVVGVVRVAVVAPEVDRPLGHARVGGVAEVGDPDRPAVAHQPVVDARRLRRVGLDDRPEPVEVVAPRRPAGPDVPAAPDAARRVPRRQLDEVADLLEVGRIGVGDDVEAAAAGGDAGAAAGRARAERRVGVPRVERADDELAARVELHVLVLPVAVRGEVGRQEGVQRLRVRGIAHVERAEAEAPRDHEHLAAPDGVELALGDAPGVRHPRDVLQVVRDRRPLRRLGAHRAARCRQQRRHRGRQCRCPSLHPRLPSL